MKKHNAIQKFSPFALGIMVCAFQVAQTPLAYGASLKGGSVDSGSLLKPIVPEMQSFPSSASSECAPAPVGGGSALPSAGASTPLNASSQSALNLSASSSVLASSATSVVGPSALTAQATGIDPSLNLIAQVPVLDDCCAVGGTATCEVGGVPPSGGGVLAGATSPLWGLLATPLLIIPGVIGGGGGEPTPPPVPEPSSTAGITAALGLLGLWYGRRFRASHKTSS